MSKILILNGSPRKNGNTARLVEEFSKGAAENGNTIIRFDCAFKNVHPCIDCGKCNMNGDCVFQDDFNLVKQNLIDADFVVIATPMHYFGISAQIKIVIDRFYSANRDIKKTKKAVLLLSYADNADKSAEPILSHYRQLIDYLGWKNYGEIIAKGVWAQGDVDNTPFVKQSYELGKSI